jgi:hypothetical protein
MPVSADEAFVSLAQGTLDELLERWPEWATQVGDHRHDHRLTAGTPDHYTEMSRWAAGRLRDLDRLAGPGSRPGPGGRGGPGGPGGASTASSGLSAQNHVDSEILRTRLERLRFELEQTREHEWNPMVANPGRAIYLLLARDFAPLPQRLHSVAARLTAIPESLAAARSVLGPMPRIHIETALGQFAGTARLIEAELDRALDAMTAGETTAAREATAGGGHRAGGDRAGGEQARAEVLRARPPALAAIEEHRRWLQQRLEDGDRAGPGRRGGFRDPRIGADLFRAKLLLALDAESGAEDVLSRAEADLERVTEQIAEVAARLATAPGASGAGTPADRTPGSPGSPGSPRAQRAPALVRQVLDRLAADASDDATIRDLVRRAFAAQTGFVREHRIVTVYDDPVDVIEMPEISRGVAVAYCDAPGPLETAPLPTFVAVAPTPEDWPPERVASFYREYNRHMVHDLVVHEAMPGHALQLQHSRRFTAGTQLRAALGSGSFVEGWAVYAERLMAQHGYPGDGEPAAVQMQQLKMQLRMIINAILDTRVHCDGMPESEAMALMTGRGYQEEGEAAGKWRRALLTSAQLSTYYVGYTEVSDLAADLRGARPRWPDQVLHDTMLAHGSPAARHLRRLLARDLTTTRAG